MNQSPEKDFLTGKAVAVTYASNLLHDKAFSAIKFALNCREEACSDNQKCDFHHRLFMAGALVVRPHPSIVPNREP